MVLNISNFDHKYHREAAHRVDSEPDFLGGNPRSTD